jgi:hypothetical protein
MKKLFLILYVLFILRGLYQLFEDHSWTLSFFTIVFGALGIVALLNNVQEKYLSGILIILLLAFMMSH